MKTRILSVLGLLAIGLTVAHGNQTDRPKTNGKLIVDTLASEDIRYTGKPYNKELGAYVFNARNYDPQITRWTTPDPCGFPDGANNRLYAPVPTNALDNNGLQLSVVYANETWTVSFSLAIYDPGNGTGPLITNTIAQSWEKAITNTWDHTGTDADTKQPLKFVVNITKFSYDNNPLDLTALRNNYDFVVQIAPPDTRSYVWDGASGFWASNASNLVIAHEAGHLMGAPDEYTTDDTGHTSPKDNWNHTLMGTAESPVTEDWNLVLGSNGKTAHLFE